MSILVLQHSDHGGPGRLGTTLRDHGLQLDVRRPDQPASATNRALPADLDDVHGLVILGGPQNVTDAAKYPWMQAEIELIKLAHKIELPVIGICLGSQLISHALGGEVSAMSKPEVGFERVNLNMSGQTDAIFGGIQWGSLQLLSHAQETTKPAPGTTVLASSKACKVQACKIGIRTFGFQYHFECDKPMAEALFQESKPEMERAGTTIGELRAQLDQNYDNYARVANRLCVNLVSLCFPLERRMTA
jgi:GMP synthase (glutamine-hydrolysing)